LLHGVHSEKPENVRWEERFLTTSTRRVSGRSTHYSTQTRGRRPRAVGTAVEAVGTRPSGYAGVGRGQLAVGTTAAVGIAFGATARTRRRHGRPSAQVVPNFFFAVLGIDSTRSSERITVYIDSNLQHTIRTNNITSSSHK
jgi:hypothetical protein